MQKTSIKFAINDKHAVFKNICKKNPEYIQLQYCACHISEVFSKVTDGNIEVTLEDFFKSWLPLYKILL